MFKCQVTNKLSKPLQKLNRLVIKTRPIQYRHWNRESEEEWFTNGFETVREINATDEGVELWNSLTPDQREAFVKKMK